MPLDCPFSRRSFLAGSGALFAWTYLPRIASAAGARDPRFLTIVLRGGLDGLSAVPAVGDPDYAGLRRELNLDGDAVLPLDGLFALNRSMTNLHRLWTRREAVILHAVATPYRERSHFDGQDVLETGLARPGGREGWLARALAAIPRGTRTRRPTGLAIGPATPLILRGPAEITSWSPQSFPAPSEETARRVIALYEARDPALAAALAAGIETGRTAAREGLGGTGSSPRARLFAEQARAAAARFMALEDGPRLAAMSFEGWDTHADQGPRDGRLARLLTALDGAIGALEQGLAPVWRDTVVAIVTEFGRTAGQNGTEGTDHGTATIALLLGGAVDGGRVVADWPGLAEARLYERRDLAPTTDLRAVMKGVLADHLGVPAGVLADTAFPGSAGRRARRGTYQGVRSSAAELAKRSRMSVFVELTGAAAALVTTLCWVPQALHILRTRETAGVSLPTYLAFAAGNVLWLLYGLFLGSWPLIGANSVTLALASSIVVLKLRYGARAA